AADSIELRRITSCRDCLSPPFLTALINRFSVAINGRYSFTALSITFLFTTSPVVTFLISRNTASAARKASGRAILLFAESSSVLSNHWVDAVIGAFIAFDITYRASEQMRSQRIGLRLYA